MKNAKAILKSEQQFEFFSTHSSAANRKMALEKRFRELQSIYDKLGKAQTPPVKTTLKHTTGIKKKKNAPLERYIREIFEKDTRKYN